MSSKKFLLMLNDEKVKKMTAGEFAKTTKGLEWLDKDWTPSRVVLITNRRG